tara:strand:- start:1243 stop:2277 length:1035 start_codon:yes stop_codon:yes gene_type:complete
MKIAIINDTHFGVRNDSSFFLERFLTYFEEKFFPYLIENKITTVFHLGDLLDRRKYVNIHTLNQVKKRFIEPLSEMGIDFHMVIGNHDMYFRNTNEINSASELFSDYDNFNLHETPFVFEHDGLCIGLVPWVCRENEEKILEFLENCSCPIVMGHFELSGYQVLSGVNFKGGMSDASLKRFEMVLSGHFHSRSQKNNVHYLGTQYDMTFADADCQKGFSVFDTKTRNLEFIENKDGIFYVLNTENFEDDNDYSQFKDKYIKIIVDKETSKTKVDKILANIDKNSPHDLSVIEDFSIGEDGHEKVDLSKDTITIINEEIDFLDDNLDKLKLKTIMKDIYLEALNL